LYLEHDKLLNRTFIHNPQRTKNTSACSPLLHSAVASRISSGMLPCHILCCKALGMPEVVIAGADTK